MEFIGKISDKLEDYSGSIILALVVLIAGILIIKLCLKIAGKALTKTRLDPSIYKFILSVIRITLYVVLLVIILSCLKVPTAPLVTVIGAVGAAIALALQGSLSNVAAGFLILVNQPFKRGDFVDTNGYSGIVDAIDITCTTLQTVDNRTVILPNSAVLGSAIVNNTSETIRRVDLSFGIAYSSDIAHAKDVIMDVCQKNQYVLEKPVTFVGVGEHGESAVILDLRAWVATPNYLPAKYELQEQVKLAFDEAGIVIPFKQVDVHLDK
ncbi:MAG: mechanosensitive ion channel family protein [Firmicutes bacterium]|nr:mechanosensitive ion channel family protein [Bacillota bacterium]